MIYERRLCFSYDQWRLNFHMRQFGFTSFRPVAGGRENSSTPAMKVKMTLFGDHILLLQ